MIRENDNIAGVRNFSGKTSLPFFAMVGAAACLAFLVLATSPITPHDASGHGGGTGDREHSFSLIEQRQVPLSVVGGLLVLLGASLGWALRASMTGERDRMLTQLRESEDRFRNLSAAAFDGVLLSDRGHVVDANDQLLAMFGYDWPGFLNLTIADMVAPESRAQVMEAVHAGQPVHREQRLVRRDGSSFYGEARAKMVQLGGRPIRVTVLRDVTERKRADDARLASEELLKQFIEHAPAAIAMLDKDLRYLQTSDRWLTDYDLEGMNLRGKSHYEVFPDLPERWKEAHRRVLEGAVERCDEDFFSRKSGHSEWLEWECRPWRDAAGEIGGMIVFSQVISARKQMEQAVRASEQRFRGLFDAAYELMGTLDSDGRLVAANRTALDFAGAREHDVVGRSFWECPWWSHSTEQQERLRAAIARAAAGELVRMEATHVDAHGELRDMDFSLTPLAPEAGGAPLLLAEGRDVTELRRAEHERAELQAALHQAQRLDSIGRLAGGIAHDFNNLLTVIVGQIELSAISLKRGEDPNDHVQAAVQACESAAALTRQLLIFARKQASQPEVLQVNDTVQAVQHMLRRVIGEDIAMSIDLAPALANVRMDRAQLEQVVMNLLVNARDAMPDGGTISIRTRTATRTQRRGGESERLAPYVQLQVSDTGIGMSDEVMRQVFEPLFTTKGPGKGTGIGLATVDSAVDRAGGFVEVHSTKGLGSTFDVYLPATSEAPERKRLPASALPNGSERVVLVEDQISVRTLAERQLRMLGYAVTCYGSAEEAMQALTKDCSALDLLITDVVLEGLTGPALVECLQAPRPDLRVLYMSGYTDDAVLTRGLQQTAHLLHKPFSLQELAQAVRSVLDVAT